MRVKIKTSNITYFIRQEFGFHSIDQFFDLTNYHNPLRNKIIHRMVNEFTGYKIENEKLITYNPYTDKNESLKLKSFDHIISKEELLKDLSLLHKTRMEMLEQSRSRILELSQEQDTSRDIDLKITQERTGNSNKRELLRRDKNSESTLER